jgi:hypothetical protein
MIFIENYLRMRKKVFFSYESQKIKKNNMTRFWIPGGIQSL